MSNQKNEVSLNIFLVKEPIIELHEIIRKEKYDYREDIHLSGGRSGIIFIQNSPVKTPKWASFFTGKIDLKKIGKTSSVSAALVINFVNRFFVLVFGPGGRFLIKEDVMEERFGLVVALKCIDKETLKCIDKQSFDSIQSHSRIQSIEGTSSDKFGIDIEQDLLRAVVGKPANPDLGSRMTGNDSLIVNVSINLNDLPHLLDEYRIIFESGLNNTEYEWVNNIAQLNGRSKLIEKLDDLLMTKFLKKDFDKFWISIPEIIPWDVIKGFSYDGGKKVIHPFIDLEGFLPSVEENRINISLELLKRRRVRCVDSNHDQVHKSWSIYKCIYAEADLDGQKYILTGGTWFRLKTDFVERTNREFSQIQRSSLQLPNYEEGPEGAYNRMVVQSDPEKYLLMDGANIYHGGGQGKVEFCDIFSRHKEIIHIKKFGQAKVFSHLFSQGLVSGQLLQLDKEFRRKVGKKMKNNQQFSNLIEIEARPKENEFTIVFGIIKNGEDKDIDLPFFSRVNLNNGAKILQGFGYKVELLKINVDPIYAKQKTFPTSKKGVR